jgi:hypothetical protein
VQILLGIAGHVQPALEPATRIEQQWFRSAPQRLHIGRQRSVRHLPLHRLTGGVGALHTPVIQHYAVGEVVYLTG